MRAVLGIDAAWTSTQPSGVAVAVQLSSGWRIASTAPSYGGFCSLPNEPSQSDRKTFASEADVVMLLSSARRVCGSSIDLIAVDMPLARTPINGRRVADNAVSTAYAARRCGTHSPSALRPGPVGERLRDELEKVGYPLLTNTLATRGTIEVYPHPALVELAKAPRRLPYKVAKIGRYWPEANSLERRERLLKQWSQIIELLDNEVAGVRIALPLPSTNASTFALKAFEDTLDAVVCAWVGICALKGHAKPYGNQDSAIWIPC